jgi:hypothetical protein
MYVIFNSPPWPAYGEIPQIYILQCSQAQWDYFHVVNVNSV